MELLGQDDRTHGWSAETVTDRSAAEERGQVGLSRFYLFFQVRSPTKLSGGEFDCVHPAVIILVRQPAQLRTKTARLDGLDA